ncbi:SMC-Scp complex subunit ScpB [Patescibacteria group bacterium]|nr:SMC-Scp complex subunit ScpB [Patescibacteria group bacterium]MBU4512630.1 SMC-Scp complex subunit ScpB [Patescibacteria group bacterium]MCG2693536.1 SMC-Scp complex subunit ScpB [Candidatus Parcubacteria bacterium]
MSLTSKIESTLFISPKPFSIKELVKLSGAKPAEIEEAIGQLKEKYNNPESGLWLVENKTLKDKEIQLATSPDNQDIVQKFLKDDMTGELTRPALETLTIIAYRGPMTKPEIEQIRGINCSLILRNLLIKGLVEVEEKQREPYYRISFEFLKYLGLKSVNELPDYDKLHQHESLEEYLRQNE